MKSLYLTVDSLALKAEEPTDITLYLDETLPSNFDRVGLRSITISQPVQDHFYYVHCDLLNKDDNLFNGEKSDILVYFVVNQSKKFVSHKFGGILHKNLKSSDFTSIRLTLKDRHGMVVKLQHVTYELEFIK